MFLCAHVILQLEAETPNHLNFKVNPEFVGMDSKITPITDGIVGML